MPYQPDIPNGSFVYYESFDSVMALLTDQEELTVRRALSAFAFDREMPEMSERELCAFRSIAPQVQANKVKRANGKRGGRPKGEKPDNEEENGNACSSLPPDPKPDQDDESQSETSGYAEEETSGFAKEKTSGFAKQKPNVNVNVNANVNGNVNVNGNTPQTPQGEHASDVRSHPHSSDDAQGTPDTIVTKTISKQKRFVKPTAVAVAAYAAERGRPDFDANYFIDHYNANGWLVGKNKMRDWKATVRNWIAREKEFSRSQPTARSNGRPDIYTDWSKEIAEMEAAAAAANG